MREGVLVADKYRILRKIGEGGMGSVWLARNETTEREFAIKFMSAEFAHSEQLTSRFLQEAKVAGRLRHPSLLEIFDAGVARQFDNAPFLVMELLDGVPLDDAIQQARRLPVGTALELMSTVAHAMGVVHDKGILHRDLKPANIFMHRPGTGAIVPKVLDFGISKVTSEDGRMKPSGLTQTGHVLGSPIYMSPEQASSDKTIDARSDVHALGVLLWECIVGQPPFSADNYNTLVVEIMVNERPRLDSVVPGISPSLANLVARAFALQRENRFPSAIALANAIDGELDRMGHVRVLDSRAGAEFFLGLLADRRGNTAVLPPHASSTTSALAVPARSVGIPGHPPAPYPPGSPEVSSPPAAAASAAQRRWLVPLGIGALSVLIVGAVGIGWRLSTSTPADISPHADTSTVPATPTASASAAQLADLTPDAAATPLGASVSASAPAVASSSVPPTAHPPAATRVTPTSTPASTRTTPPAHHGVEDDGL